jgi:flavin-dependent dehydrogenase
LPDAPRVRGLRFVAGSASTDADFPEGFGMVVRRDWFDAWLFEKAAATPNVDARTGMPYRSEGEPFVVGADGRHSHFHRRLEARRPRHTRVGQSTHVTGLDDVSDRVEVFFHRDGELYVAPTGGGETLVAALFHQSRFRRDGITYLLDAIPEMRALATREADDARAAASPLGCACRAHRGRGLLLIGDAAGAPIRSLETASRWHGIGVAGHRTRSSQAIASYERVRLEMGRNADGWDDCC